LTIDDIILLLIIIFIFGFIFLIFRFKSKTEREYERKLKESLNEEFIIDPNTGAKLTLEQAQSGHWIQHDNEFLPREQNHFLEDEQEVEKSLNYLRVSHEYQKQKLTNEQVDLLEKTKILSKYNDWSYSDTFRIEYCNGFVFHPAVNISGNQHTYYDDDYNESQIMFWIELNFNSGHYYLREKSNSEKLLDIIRNDDDLRLDNYESFTFEKSENMILVNNILNTFKGEKDLEIEFYHKNLFFKNRKLINLEDLLRLEKIAKNVC